MTLYGELKAAYATAFRAGDAQDFDRQQHLKGIVESRLSYMSTKFWEKYEKHLRKNNAKLRFSDLLDLIMRRMRVLKVQGAAAVTPTPLVHTAPRPEVVSCACQGASYAGESASSPSAERCNVCADSHSTQRCTTLGSLPVEERVSLLSSRRLCFICLRHGHIGTQCPEKATTMCECCARYGHNTLLHGRKPFPSPRQTSPPR